MNDNDEYKNIAPSPMMTEDGRNELYLYSLKKMAEHNAEKNRISLTGLYGTIAFLYKGNELLHDNPDAKFALIRMDIYRFKTINEFCGRADGDRLLVFVADCFKEHERNGAIAGHLRADIFTLLTPYETKEDLVNIVTDIANKIDNFPLPCKILPAFGICLSEYGMDISLLSDYANLALQTIKGSVFTCYAFYDEKFRQQLLYEKKIENEIKPALEKDEIKLYIQPKVHMITGEIIGGEALMRWDHSTDGFINPSRFIPVLERSGYIVDVDKYMWQKVFSSLRNIIERGEKPVPVSINISRVHAYQPDFDNIIYKLADQYNIPPALIQLELTESAFTENTKILFETMNRLQMNGYYISMDDFGSGYSSMNMLKDEPLDEIKIDRVFLDDISKDKSRSIIKHLISMISDLGIHIIAEGVETQEQANFLIECGCLRAQGYYFYKPMPVEEFEELLKKNHFS